ncbi:hypothetical protein J7E96_17580 [Streptomyces sp. ISL-96]|uniref:hypothetical protein n=1 Tax=Streptomyces sp. ISL-96 TaxID=2819191 RepID=UPI001BE759DC|nr:hypothetical protein [Streptomyces sp. ISL-96]MBT2490297.1 hypothetical protein [Streptomyces sp. ISL-96]
MAEGGVGGRQVQGYVGALGHGPAVQRRPGCGDALRGADGWGQAEGFGHQLVGGEGGLLPGGGFEGVGDQRGRGVAGLHEQPDPVRDALRLVVRQQADQGAYALVRARHHLRRRARPVRRRDRAGRGDDVRLGAERGAEDGYRDVGRRVG